MTGDKVAFGAWCVYFIMHEPSELGSLSAFATPGATRIQRESVPTCGEPPGEQTKVIDLI